MQACLSPTEIALSGYKGGAKRRTATDKRTTYRKSTTKVRFRPAKRAELGIVADLQKAYDG